LAVLTGELTGISEPAAASLVERYHRPRPRCGLGPRLIGVATSAIDVSDGLMADLGHICKASGMSASIEADRVPLSEAAREALSGDSDLLTRVLGGGDDYEILFSAAATDEAAVQAAGAAAGVTVARIGTVEEAGEGRAGAVSAVGADGRVLAVEAGGFRHF
jgi:thiamine-monophosphate kinase